MKKTLIIVLIALAAYVVIFYLLKKVKKNGALDYLHSLGFGVADRMNQQEIEDSYNYLYNYARRYAQNAAAVVKATNPALYARLQAIVNKYGALFNLNTETSVTNIPNIQTPVGATPIVPNVPITTAQNPANNNNNITPPTLNIV